MIPNVKVTRNRKAAEEEIRRQSSLLEENCSSKFAGGKLENKTTEEVKD